MFLRVEAGLMGFGGILDKAGLRKSLDRLRPATDRNSGAKKPAGKSHPFTFRPGTQDRSVFVSVNRDNEYRLPDSFEPDDVIVDIGTHIGSFCYAALRRGANHVFGFEAEKSNYEQASENLRSFGERVRLRNAAVWRSDETVEKLTFTPSHEEGHTAGGNVWSGSGEEVDAVAFDEVIREATDGGTRRVKMLNMDCEGSEFPILFTSRMLHLVDDIRGEFHEFGGEHDPHSIPESAGVPGFERFTINELSNVLRGAGFTVDSVRRGDSNMGLFFASRSDS